MESDHAIPHTNRSPLHRQVHSPFFLEAVVARDRPVFRCFQLSVLVPRQFSVRVGRGRAQVRLVADQVLFSAWLRTVPPFAFSERSHALRPFSPSATRHRALFGAFASPPWFFL